MTPAVFALLIVFGSDSSATSLVEAELAFCRAAVSQGTREAFLTYLAEDAIVFRPGPVPGRPVYRDSEPSSAILTWHPVQAEVSRAKDLGYTTGPWVYRKKAGDSPVGYGQYVSVWRTQADGQWRVILDVGIDHPEIDTTSGPVYFGYPSEDSEIERSLGVDTAAELRTLMNLDRALSLSSSKQGFVRAVLAEARNDVRLYRSGGLPIIGFEAVKNHSTDLESGSTWEPTGGVVSRSGDLGYTFGKAESLKQDSGVSKQMSYVRIWRKQSEMKWKVVLDLAIPLP